jgi:hypothetical protein
VNFGSAVVIEDAARRRTPPPRPATRLGGATNSPLESPSLQKAISKPTVNPQEAWFGPRKGAMPFHNREKVLHCERRLACTAAEYPMFRPESFLLNQLWRNQPPNTVLRGEK